MRQHYIIPIFVPHLGCPNDCIFCNQKSISGEQRQVSAKEVKEQIEFYWKSFKNKETAFIEVAFFGGSFTGIPQEKQIELLQAVQEYIDKGKVNSIRISTRPDYINKEILKLLKKYKVHTIELGVQSSNDYILRRSKKPVILVVNKADNQNYFNVSDFYALGMGEPFAISSEQSLGFGDLLDKITSFHIRIRCEKNPAG